MVSDDQGNAFYAENVSAGAAATWHSWTGPGVSPSEAVACPTTSLCTLAAGAQGGYGGKLYYATSLGGSFTLATAPANGVISISCPSSSFCVEGQNGFGYFRYSTNPASTSWTLEQQGTGSLNAVSCLSSSFCAFADSGGNVRVGTSTTQIESSGWTLTNVDGSTALTGIACTSTSSCVAVDAKGNAIKLAINGEGKATATTQSIDGTNKLTAISCTGATCAAVDEKGNVFISANGGESWRGRYAAGAMLASVSCASTSLCAAADATGKITTFAPG